MLCSKYNGNIIQIVTALKRDRFPNFKRSFSMKASFLCIVFSTKVIQECFSTKPYRHIFCNLVTNFRAESEVFRQNCVPYHCPIQVIFWFSQQGYLWFNPREAFDFRNHVGRRIFDKLFQQWRRQKFEKLWTF